MKINRAIKEFLRLCSTAKGLSKNTHRNYSTYLKKFENWASANKLTEIEQLTSEDVLDFQASLENQTPNPLSKKTRNYYLIALRSLLNFLINRDINVLNPSKITLSKIEQRQIEFLEIEEIERLTQATEQKKITGLRDKAIISLLFSSGLRIGELINLKKNQINTKTGECSVKGKGGKVRLVFISKEAQQDLENYLSKRKDKNPFLFIRHFRNPRYDNKSNQPLTARSIQRLLNHYALKAGIVKNVTPHKLRHSFATDLLRNGADLRSVQALLGHSSVTTTQIYTHVTDPALKEVHQKYHHKKSSQED